MVSGAAIIFALSKRIRYAMCAMAGLILLNWVSYLPSFAIHGTAGTEGFGGLWVAYQLFIAPVFAGAGSLALFQANHAK